MHAHHRLSTQRQQPPLPPPRFTFYLLHQFGPFRRFCPSFRRSAARHCPYQPSPLSCGFRIHILDPGPSQVQGTVPVALLTPSAPCLAFAVTVRCRSKTAPGPCPPLRLHMLTLVPCSKRVPPLTLLLHVFILRSKIIVASHLLNMCRCLPPRYIILCACLLCTPPSFRASPKPSACITLSDIVKDGLTYENAFDGHQAVDKVAYIIKTTDCNLALLLGRALDVQKYFHAVTYDHRLRDSQSDVYQFRTRMGSPFHSDELTPPPLTSSGSHGTTTPTPYTRTGSPSNEASNESDPGKHQDTTAADHGTDADADAAEGVICLLPTEVSTLLTDCYSPTCSRDRLCYSITCPRRLEQQNHLNIKLKPGLGIKRQLSGDLCD
jgi:hypothetical protein